MLLIIYFTHLIQSIKMASSKPEHVVMLSSIHTKSRTFSYNYVSVF